MVNRPVPCFALTLALALVGCEDWWAPLPDPDATATPTGYTQVSATPTATPGARTPTETPTATQGPDADQDGFTADVDCDDGEAAIYPGAPEVCEDTTGVAIDNDCDGEIDEDIGYQTWYLDADDDGYGDPTVFGDLFGCDHPDQVLNNDDCDDSDRAIHPDAAELYCNGVDEDCDGATVDNPDVDGDGYDICEPSDNGDDDNRPADCDDTLSSINPGLDETADQYDTNCDGELLVPAGLFVMGSDNDEGEADEKPEHLVQVPAFEMPITEATVADYKACVSRGDCTTPITNITGCNYSVAGRDAHPINCISWYQAVSFCASTGRRLPTEAEWERAARGSCDTLTSTGCDINPTGTDGEADERTYPWGRAWPPSCERANYVDVEEGSCVGATAPVGSYPEWPSAAGALDMAGNVAEWVADCYHTSYAGAPDDGSQWTTGCVASSRVARGGAWSSGEEDIRVSARQSLDPIAGYTTVGVRCVNTPGDTAPTDTPTPTEAPTPTN